MPTIFTKFIVTAIPSDFHLTREGRATFIDSNPDDWWRGPVKAATNNKAH
jgi:hypothetical protein